VLFSRRGVTTAFLKEVGKVDSLRQRFSRVVIGGSKAPMQDLSSLVGRMSRRQVASEAERMTFLTSSSVVNKKSVSKGGGWGGSMCGDE